MTASGEKSSSSTIVKRNHIAGNRTHHRRFADCFQWTLLMQATPIGFWAILIGRLCL
ncbi:hypothetical protein HanXRQr2_Chr16g0749081 [Helianthus annuus]|uniref:Uncharacterized protein n=1 Tax=Helianthus annuus TaxID=4232 RepID=A0A251RZ04_HELAN|nr:hypothetical protein HanXRQr2_Chr16g0749081 [Helianthus annuus]KAJ0460508.1 hypothetical protein HanHA89_Chr16g0661611 [Helianthus annuus]